MAGGRNAFVKHILEIFALIMLTGVFSTLLLPETKGVSLENLSVDNTVSIFNWLSASAGDAANATKMEEALHTDDAIHGTLP